jgi:hypothetical protein
MVNGKGFGRKWSRSFFKTLSLHSPGETDENHKNIQLG